MPGLELVRYPNLTRGWQGIPEAYTWFTMIAWLEGDVEVISRGVRATCQTGSVTVGAPGEPYVLRPHSAMRGEFRVIRVDNAALGALLEDIGIPSRNCQFPREPLRFSDHARRFAQCFDAIARGESLGAEQHLLEFIAALLMPNQDVEAPNGYFGPGGVARARELLHARFDAQVSLDELAHAAGLSRFALLRAFSRDLGMTPHAYQVQLRMAHACRLIASAVPIVEAALAVGYSEQSALQRPFRRLIGVTPGEYARALR
jgi:AraC-like DNA-binding protein